jgi:Flp pilus assembly CpaE family ATPase
MKIQDYEQKTIISKDETLIKKQICEFFELFLELTSLEELSFYNYEYEYNEFFYKYSLNRNGDKIDNDKNIKTYKILLRYEDIVYGYIEFDKRIKSSKLLKKLLNKINIQLKNQKELEKHLNGDDTLFNILLIHDENLEAFAKNLNSGLKALFNAEIKVDTSIQKHLEKLKLKEQKHIILFLIEDESKIKEYKEFLKTINETIIVIGPNNHKTSIYCGKLGIENYISIHEFKAEDIKEIVLKTRKNLQNKNSFDNKIIALSGISGGVGTTTIAMNMSDLIAQNLPNKNVLFIDLSTTKAISNLFLQNNPLPEKSIIDLINTSEFNIEQNLENGLIKKDENFYCVTGIQKHIDKEYLEKDIFIEKLLDYIVGSSEYFNYIIIDLGQADSSNLKTTIYDLVNELWLVTQMNLPHISKVKTFYSLLKRAGLKEKTSFLVNRYDSQNAISVNDVMSILNMSNVDKFQFDDFKIPNDYQNLGRCWNYCELASQSAKNSSFIERLDFILEKKEIYKKEQKKDSWLSNLLKKSKS